MCNVFLALIFILSCFLTIVSYLFYPDHGGETPMIGIIKGHWERKTGKIKESFYLEWWCVYWAEAMIMGQPHCELGFGWIQGAYPT